MYQVIFCEKFAVLEGYELVKEVYLLLDDGDHRFLNQYALTQVQYLALLRLQEGPKPLSQLSKELLCDPSNITRVAGTLERKGWITRVRDETDRRLVFASITVAGEQVIRRAQEAHRVYVQQRMAVLDEQEQENLLVLLNKLGTGLRAQLQTREPFSPVVSF